MKSITYSDLMEKRKELCKQFEELNIPKGNVIAEGCLRRILAIDQIIREFNLEP